MHVAQVRHFVKINLREVRVEGAERTFHFVLNAQETQGLIVLKDRLNQCALISFQVLFQVFDVKGAT